MIRGTTPTHTFELPEAVTGNYSKVNITYVQDKTIILEKDLEDLTVSSNKVSFTMTQAETLLFTEGVRVEIQIKVLTTGGLVLASKIFSLPTERILNTEVL